MTFPQRRQRLVIDLRYGQPQLRCHLRIHQERDTGHGLHRHPIFVHVQEARLGLRELIVQQALGGILNHKKPLSLSLDDARGIALALPLQKADHFRGSHVVVHVDDAHLLSHPVFFRAERRQSICSS
jgi:hypothetical protein